MNSTPPPVAENPETTTLPRWSVGTLTYTTGGLIVLFCWLLWGDFAWSMKERAVWPSAQIMFKKFDASDLITGLLLGTLPGAISLMIGPIISYRSDRLRSRWGRRIPFLLIPTPFIVLSMLGMAYSPECGRWLHQTLGNDSPGLNAASLVMLGCFWMFFEVGTIAANTVFGGLVNDVVPHHFLGRFYGLFRALSLIAGVAFNYWIMGHVETHYRVVFVGVAVLYGLGILTMCLKVKEGDYPPPLEENSHSAMGTIRSYFSECFGNSYYVIFFLASTMAGMSLAPSYSFNVYYAKSLNMSLNTYGECTAITYGISLLMAYPLGALADRYHPLRVGIVAIGLYSAINLLGALTVHDVPTFAWAMIAQGVAGGIYLTTTASIGQMLLPKAKFLQYASAMGILMCLGGMIVSPLTGWILDHTGHQYRHLFSITSGFAFLSLLGYLLLYRQFEKLGGPEKYVAP